MYGLPGGILQRGSFAAVAQAAGVLAGYHNIGAVLSRKCVEVFDDENVLIR